jgi:hypothetical protein
MPMSFYERIAAASSAQGAAAPLAVDWFTVHLRLHTASHKTRQYIAGQHHLMTPSSRLASLHDPTDLSAVADDSLLNEIRATFASAADNMREAFRGEWYQVQESHAGDTVLLRAEAGCSNPHALITRDFISWAIVSSRADGLGLVTTRTIRELIRENLLAQGAIMFHGSAAERPDGRGVFLAGASSTGKTSAAVRIALGGGRVVGTDKTFLLRRDGDWLAVGLPMSTRLSAGSVEAMGLLQALRDRSPIRAINPFKHGVADIPVEGPPQLAADKVWLSNAELHELTGCGFADSTRADSIVVLKNSPRRQPVVAVLDPVEAADALRDHMLAPDPDYRSRWLACDPAPESRQPALSRLDQLLRERRVSRVAWNPALHCDEHTSDLVPAGLPHPVCPEFMSSS